MAFLSAAKRLLMRTAVMSLLAVLTLMLSACGGIHMVKQDIKPPLAVKSGKAVLVIMRTASFYGDTDIKNYLDGKYIGGDKDNCYFMTDVKPGVHYLTADGGNKDTVRMNFEAGRIYFLRQGVAPGVFRSFTQYFAMTLEDALHEVQVIDFMVYDTKHPGNDLSQKDYEAEKKDYDEEVKKDPSHRKDVAQYKGFNRVK
jgi:hypothetical protein